ncbi:MAG: hypothetical protein OHK0029_08230 [Armatimonadaceae bacterium]
MIELLVVIAIIAILAAILFPVFAQARQKARQASSLSNMKQIALAILMYSQDYDEMFPRTMFSPDGMAPPEPVGWFSVNEYQRALEPYIKMGRGANDSGANRLNNVWWDPADPDRGTRYLWGSYSDNGFITGTPRTQASIQSPASTVLSTLRVNNFAAFALEGQALPAAPPPPTDGFWRSAFFDMCLDPWSDSSNPADPYHWARGRAIPPCELFPQQLCGEWHLAMDKVRYNGSTLFAYCDGHVRAGRFAQTYRSADDNDWDIF